MFFKRRSPLDSMRRFLLRAFVISVRRPKTVLAAFFLSLIAMSTQLIDLKMLLSVDDLIDPSFETYNDLKHLNQNFLNQNEIILVVTKPSSRPWSKPELCAIKGWIQKTVDSSHGIDGIVSSFGLLKPKETNAELYFEPLLKIDCTTVEDETESIQRGFEKIKVSPWQGLLNGREDSDIAILIYPLPKDKSDFFGRLNAELIESLKSSFQENVSTRRQELRAAWIGDGIFQYFLKKGYEYIPLLNTLLSFLVLIFCQLVYRTWSSGVLLLSAVTWASIPVYSGMAFFNHPIDVLSSALSLMLLVTNVEDYVLLTELRRKSHWRKCYRQIILPSFLTSLTTFIGFGSLAFADVEMIQRFGVWAAFGSMMQWIVLFTVLPALMTLFPKLRNWVSGAEQTTRLSLLLNWLANIRLKKPVLLLSFIVFPLAAVGPNHLLISDSPQGLFSESHPAIQDLKVIEQTRNWRGHVSLVFADHNARESNQKKIEEVQSWSSVIAIENPESIEEYLTAAVSPEMKSFVANSVRFSTVTARLGPNNLEESRVLLYLENIDLVDTAKIRADLQKLCSDKTCWPAGSLISYSELGTKVMSTLYKSLGISLLLVCFIIGLLAWALSRAFIVPILLSVIWGPAALLTCFYVFQIPVFYITSMIASIVVGVAGDNAIQYIFNTKKNDFKSSVEELSVPAIVTAFAMCLAASVFFFGYFAPMKTLGGLLILGFSLSVIGDVWVLRGLLSLKQKWGSRS